MKFITRLSYVFIANCVLFSTAAFAAHSNLNFAVGRDDVSYQLLEAIFGRVDGVLYGTGTQIVGQMFAVFNAAVLAIGGAFLTYTLLVSTINTAQDGEVMGKKWSSVWIPVRTTMGVGLLVPKASGYCMMQIFVMWIVVQGIGAANQIWKAALGYLQAGGVVAAKPLAASKEADNDAGTNTGSTILNTKNKEQAALILDSLICMESLQRSLESYRRALLDNDAGGNFEIPESVPDFFSNIRIEPAPIKNDSQGYAEARFDFPTISDPDSDYSMFNGVCGTLLVKPVGDAKAFAKLLKDSEQAAAQMEAQRLQSLAAAAKTRAVNEANAAAGGKFTSLAKQYAPPIGWKSAAGQVASGEGLLGGFVKSSIEAGVQNEQEGVNKAAGEMFANAVTATGERLSQVQRVGEAFAVVASAAKLAQINKVGLGLHASGGPEAPDFDMDQIKSGNFDSVMGWLDSVKKKPDVWATLSPEYQAMLNELEENVNTLTSAGIDWTKVDSSGFEKAFQNFGSALERNFKPNEAAVENFNDWGNNLSSSFSSGFSGEQKADASNVFIARSKEMELVRKMQMASFTAVQQVLNELQQTAAVIVDRNEEQAAFLRANNDQAAGLISKIGHLEGKGATAVWTGGLTTGYEIKMSLMAYYAYMLPYLNATSREADQIKFIPKAISQGWIMAGSYFFEIARLTQDLSDISASKLPFAGKMEKTADGSNFYATNGQWRDKPQKFFENLFTSKGKSKDSPEAKAQQYSVDVRSYLQTEGVSDGVVKQGVLSMWRPWRGQYSNQGIGVKVPVGIGGMASFKNDEPLYDYLASAQAIPLPDSIFNEVELMDISVADIVPQIGEPNFRLPPCRVKNTFGIPCAINGILMGIIKVVIDVIGGVLIAGINMILSTVLAPFLQIIPAMFHSLFAAVFERATSQSTHPIINMAHIGEMFLGAAAGLWIGFLVLVIILSCVPFVTLGKAADVLKMLVQMCLIFLGLFGYNFAYYIPLLPYTIFLFASVAWFIAVIEAMVAAPIVALGLSHPEGQNEVFGKAEQAMMIILNIFLRPSMMIIGFVVAIVLSYVLTAFLGATFAKVYLTFMASPAEVNSPVAGMDEGLGFVKIFGPIFLLIIFVGLFTEIIKTSFSLIYVLPDQVLRFIGGPTEQLASGLVKGMEQGAQQAFTQGAGKVGFTAKAAGAAADKHKANSSGGKKVAAKQAASDKKKDDAIKKKYGGGD